MPLTIEQKSNYQGNDYWRWSVWLNGSKEELNSVRYVEYRLHPTFPNPVRRISAREDNFRLQSSGWGEFVIYANVLTQKGQTIRLSHKLELRYPGGKRTQYEASNPIRRIFLSFNREDLELANTFLGQTTYRDYNLQILASSPESIPSADAKNIRANLRQAIEGSYAVVCLIGRHTDESRWVKWELETAKELGCAIVGVKLPTGIPADIPELLTEYKAPIVDWDFDAISRALDKVEPPHDAKQPPK